MAEVTFYYDVVCPYAYMASTRIDAIAGRAGATVRWVPILLGGLLRHVGSPDVPAAAMAPARARYNLLDIGRQAERMGVPLTVPSAHPRRTVAAMRLIVGAPPSQQRALAAALFRAYWVEGRDVANRRVLAAVAREHGVDVAVVDDSGVKSALFANTAAAADLGAFGVPAMQVGDRFWWGADRLHFVADALGLPPAPGPGTAKTGVKLTFFHDFSSPFSYLASTQVGRVAAEAGAELEWAPMLLGAVFRDIGTADVPMMTFNGAKQRYYLTDLHDWARWWGVPFRFPSNFPLRTVTPLRVALIEPAATAAIYRAAWGEDRNIGDPAVLGSVLDEAGFDGAALVAATSEPAVKERLKHNTARAVAAGACGAPTFVVDGEVLLWGQDRLDQVEAALRGWRPRDALS